MRGRGGRWEGRGEDSEARWRATSGLEPGIGNRSDSRIRVKERCLDKACCGAEAANLVSLRCKRVRART